MSVLRVRPAPASRLRFGPWRGDARTACIAPSPLGFGPIATADVRQCVERAALSGYSSVITAALTARDQPPFVEAGFEVAQRLHLLTHALDRLPEIASPAVLRRPRRRERPAVLAVDHRAFEPFWHLDEQGLLDALAATNAVRFRVAEHPARRGEVAGYAITGRAEHRGYVQRLAVAPEVEGQGMAAALLVDGLRWLQRRSTRDAVVNTQEGNERSLRLYQRAGFVVQPEGLAVLRLDILGRPGAAPTAGRSSV
jgi:ribosomal protein S18 acetylase RimI-like enzyme